MEMLRSSFASVLGGGETTNAGPTSADTIERLVERLRYATLLEDRRDTCRALKAMSRKFRTEVGVQALDEMVTILDKDRSDEEALGYALDTLANIVSPEEFEEEVIESRPSRSSTEKQFGSIGEQFTEIFLKKSLNVQLVLNTLEEYDFKVRRPAIKLLTNLLVSKPRLMQEIILKSQMGVSRLMDVLVDAREVLRNDALLLLIQVTKGHANLQKIVAFENAFDKLCDITTMEEYSDGGIVVEDCLKLMLNLLRNNSSNQTFFREGSYIQRISLFFDLNLDQEELEVGWAAQKVSNMLYMLSVVRTLVSPSNPTQVTTSCQNTILQCGLFDKFCYILMAVGIPADILTETIVTLGETIRGNERNQEVFSRVMAPSEPPRKALVLLLVSMVNDKQPFELRCAILYCLQCYLHKNSTRQLEVMRTLLPNSDSPEASSENDEVTAGQLLCGGLFSNDSLSNWLSAVSLCHGMFDQEDLKTELLKVQVTTAGDARGPVSLLEQILDILQQSNQVQTRIGLLILCSTWVHHSTPAVKTSLETHGVIPFLTGQIGSNEHDEMERLSQGLCAFLLGLLIIGNDNSVPNFSQDELMQLIEKRIGCEIFLDKLSEVSKHEAYNRALKHPQVKATEPSELVFDYSFCQHFKHLEHLVSNHLSSNQSESSLSDTNPAILGQYKTLIRDQDTRISQISQSNIYLQKELAARNAKIEEMTVNLQTLQDQNSLLKAQQTNGNLESNRQILLNGHQAAQELELKIKVDKLEKELKVRDDIIHELEVRLTTLPVTTPPQASKPEDFVAKLIEVNTMQAQLEALQTALANKDADMEQLKNDLTSVQAEQEDLLMMLSDQDSKLKLYKKKLKILGTSEEINNLSPDDEEEAEEDELSDC